MVTLYGVPGIKKGRTDISLSPRHAWEAYIERAAASRQLVLEQRKRRWQSSSLWRPLNWREGEA